MRTRYCITFGSILVASINAAKSWFNHTEPMFDAASIAKQFGDMNIKADLVESRGKIIVAFNGTDQNGKALKHAFVNGARINMNRKNTRLTHLKQCNRVLARNLGLQTLKVQEL